MICYFLLHHSLPHHHHFLKEKSASLSPSLESILVFQSLRPVPPGDPVHGGEPWLSCGSGRRWPLHRVLPRERCSQASHRTWSSSRRSESLPCTSQSRPACSDLLHPEGCCPVSNPCKMDQNHTVNAALIPMQSS